MWPSRPQDPDTSLRLATRALSLVWAWHLSCPIRGRAQGRQPMISLGWGLSPGPAKKSSSFQNSVVIYLTQQLFDYNICSISGSFSKSNNFCRFFLCQKQKEWKSLKQKSTEKPWIHSSTRPFNSRIFPMLILLTRPWCSRSLTMTDSQNMTELER